MRTTCATSQNPKCTKQALASYFTGDGVKLAYCTDLHIVVWSDQIPSWGSNQFIVPQPTTPTGTATGCWNRQFTGTWKATHIPINFVDSGSSYNILNSPIITSATVDPFYSYYNAMLGVSLVDLGVLVDGTDTHDTINYGSPCAIGICSEHIA